MVDVAPAPMSWRKRGSAVPQLLMERLASLSMAVSVGVLLVQFFGLFAAIVARSVFGAPLTWTGPLARLCLISLTFVGGAIAYRRGSHISVEAVVKRLPESGAVLARAASDWIVLVLSGALFAYALRLVGEAGSRQVPGIGISERWFVWPLAIGIGLMALFAVEKLVRAPIKASAVSGTLVVGVLLLAVAAHQLNFFTPTDSIGVALVVLVVTLVAGTPIGFALPLASITYLYLAGTIEPVAVAASMRSTMSDFIMVTIPMFILVGFLMTEGGLSRPLMGWVRALFGRRAGGQLQALVVSMFLFSGVSGSKLADVSAVGTATKDELRRDGYDPAEVGGVLGAAAVMGETVPPSIAMLILGSITTLPVASLFMAGLVPAVLLGLSIVMLIYLRARRRPGAQGAATRAEKIPLDQKVRLTGKALPALGVPAILAIGIGAGIGTPTEVSSLAVAYGALVAFAVYRGLSARATWTLLTDTVSMSGMILFIISAGGAFSWSLTVAQVSQAVSDLVTKLGDSPTLFLLVCIVVLTIMGSVLEGMPALLIFAPLLFPIAVDIGIEPLVFGMVLLVTNGLGCFAPPIGVGSYVIGSVCETSIEKLMGPMFAYLGIVTVGLLLITFVPTFTLIVPKLLGMSTG